jgi:Zn-dependent protease with chaperone function
VVAGLRRRRWLVLGLPLFAALEPQQRVALIAHEVGHDRAGDGGRYLVVGSAVNALDALSAAMRPPSTAPLDDGMSLFEWATRPLMWLVSRPVDGLLWLQARLLFADLQRAEYLADARAAAVAGTRAAVGLHEVLLQHPTVDLTVQHQALGGGGDDVLDHVRGALLSVPERERERRRRVARLEETRLMDTHPPTGMRIASLEAREAEPGIVWLNSAMSGRIDSELAPLEPEVGRALVDRYRSSLHYG